MFLIGICFYVGLSSAFEYNLDSANFSPSLFTLFENTLDGCSARTILQAESLEQEKIFVMLIEVLQSRTHMTFFVQTYTKKTDPLLICDTRGCSIHFSALLGIDWHFKRHSLCHAHLYLVESLDNLKASIMYHFIELDLLRENPLFVILWDLGVSKESYIDGFVRQEFYGSYMDYRLFITMDPYTHLFSVYLVCQFCHWVLPGSNFERLITHIPNPTMENIHNAWHHIYRDKMLDIPITCVYCYYRPKDGRTKESLTSLIESRLNVTMVYSDHLIFYTLGLYFEAPLAPSQIDLYFLRQSHPSFVALTFSWHQEDFDVLTVVRKSLLEQKGWISIFTPLHTSVWVTLAFSIIGLFCLLRYTVRGKAHVHIFLSVMGPLTDNWLDNFKLRQLKYIIGLWGVFCFSLSILYGGELASSLSTFSSPVVPTTLGELVATERQIISVSSVHWGRECRSQLEFKLNDELKVWNQTSNVNAWKNKSEKINISIGLINELNKSFCGCGNSVFSRKHDNIPFNCKTSQNILRLDVPVTFVDKEWYSLAARSAFKSSESYWISSTSYVPDLRETSSIVLKKNYFAKLVMPMMSSWATAGLNGDFRLSELKEQLDGEFENETNVYYDHSRSGSANVFQFSPTEMSSLTTVIHLVGGFIAIALCVVLVEVFNVSRLRAQLELIVLTLRRMTMTIFLLITLTIYTVKYTLLQKFIFCRVVYKKAT